MALNELSSLSYTTTRHPSAATTPSSAMAGIITPHFGFRPATVDHSPSPLSFGFGLSSAASLPGWQPLGMQATPFSPSPSAFSSSQKQSQKRRHDETDGDELMDRSPTPERRPVRPLKQLRVRMSDSRSQEEAGDQNKANKENRSSGTDSGDDIDVGMLLGVSSNYLSEPNSRLIYFSSHPTPSVTSSYIDFPAFDKSGFKTNCTFSHTPSDIGYRPQCRKFSCQETGR